MQENPQKAINHLNKSLLYNPNDTDVLIWCSWNYTLAVKTSAASPLAERALKLDPINPNSHLIVGAMACFEGRFGLAIESCLKSYNMSPDVPIIQFWCALCLAYDKRYENAISIFDQNLKSSVQDNLTQLGHFLKLTLQGDIDKIPQLLSKGFLMTSKRDQRCSYHIATFYSFLDQNKLIERVRYEWENFKV